MNILNQLVFDENNVVFHPMMGNSYQVNEIGKIILAQLQQSKTIDEIILMLHQNYSIPKNELYIDVQDFLSKLKIYGLA